MDNRLKVFLIVLAMSLVSAFQGCGKKGPPIPPGAIVPPRVVSLSHTLKDGAVTLTWKAPEGPGAKAVDGYDVMRSSTSLDEEECKGCPIVFQRLARLGISQTSYTDTLVLGKRYIYKVVAITSYQVAGKDSKLIRFSYPEESKKAKDEEQVESASDGNDEELEGEAGDDADGGSQAEPDQDAGPGSTEETE